MRLNTGKLQTEKSTTANRRFPRRAASFAIALALAGLIPVSAAQAQIVPFADISNYKVARVQSQGICFAALETRAESGMAMVYTYFQTATGQRWHVAGFGTDQELENGEVAVSVEVDGIQTLARGTEARDGDFMLPFESLDELVKHEELIKDGSEMSILINDGAERLVVDLAGHRAALGAIAACLGAL